MPEGYSQQQTQDKNSGFTIPKLCWATKTDVLGQGTAASMVKVLLASTCAQPRAARPGHCSSCLAQKSQSWEQMKHQVLLQRPGKVVPPTVTASLGCGDRADGSHQGSPPTPCCKLAVFPSSSPEDPGKHHPGWHVPTAETPSSSAGAYRALRWMGPNAAPRTHMGSPVWTASNHFTTTSPGREQGAVSEQDSQVDGHPGLCKAGCTFCPFLRMLQTHPPNSMAGLENASQAWSWPHPVLG